MTRVACRRCGEPYVTRPDGTMAPHPPEECPRGQQPTVEYDLGMGGTEVEISEPKEEG